MKKSVKNAYLHFKINSDVLDDIHNRCNDLKVDLPTYIRNLIDKDLDGDISEDDKPVLTKFSQKISDSLSKSISEEIGKITEKIDQGNDFSNALSCYHFLEQMKQYYYSMIRFEGLQKTTPEFMVKADSEAMKKAKGDLPVFLKFLESKDADTVMNFLKGN